MSDRKLGACEAATRAMVEGLGKLSAAQLVDAAQAVTVAALLDYERDGSKAAALSRQLGQLTARLVMAAGGRGRKDRVGELEDEIAKKRAQRAERGA